MLLLSKEYKNKSFSKYQLEKYFPSILQDEVSTWMLLS